MQTTTVSSDQPDDAELLARYARNLDAEAFGELVRRHGPMARAACRRILGESPDADDAYQAVLLILARKSGSLRNASLLGPWLHTVAVRAAGRTRALLRRRLARERPGLSVPEPASLDEPEMNDWLPLLDEEIRRLPDRLRKPLVLCELRGLSRGTVARQLGIPEGTLSSRLSRGRELLRKRLSRNGVIVTGAALAAALLAGLNAARAFEPSEFIRGALDGSVPARVASLSQGVLKSMWCSKLKISLVVVATLGVITGGMIGGWNALVIAEDAGPDAKLIQGKWRIESAMLGGKEPGGEEGKKILQQQIVIKDDQITMKHKSTFSLDPGKTPKEIDMVVSEGPAQEQGTWKGIYELKGDSLVCHLALPGTPRPEKLVSKQGEAAVLLKLKRVK